MPESGHARPEQPVSTASAHAPVQLTPEPGAEQMGPGAEQALGAAEGAAQDRGHPEASKVAPLFSHFADGADAPVQMKEKLPTGEKGFERMWNAHPHNYLEDESQNTSSAELLERLGFDPSWNTCAIRLSVMLNELGYTITPAKVQAAGLDRRRAIYSKKTKQYYIISAREMWTYLTNNFRAPDQVFPARGIYDTQEKFDSAFETQIQQTVASRRGIVAFDKLLTGYSGSGHVDLFNGLQLSDAPSWYPCRKLRLWYI
ncbi:MAG: T6SS effector amidase Tae4 family protein [Myxococcales bacterium]|nr:type VI secretion system amidase effector protein Tae4 [Myxococcota bacterium]MDW8283224.1 T6SS effector amidase Tae4 family protein [Myxococcales bacterium]